MWLPRIVGSVVFILLLAIAYSIVFRCSYFASSGVACADPRATSDVLVCPDRTEVDGAIIADLTTHWLSIGYPGSANVRVSSDAPNLQLRIVVDQLNDMNVYFGIEELARCDQLRVSE